ncbi:MAG: hypothetical protein PQJ58_18440 [Spirochaetales bacterium]|nr:hypothetical protein [Spirochaetales bacterium]
MIFSLTVTAQSSGSGEELLDELDDFDSLFDEDSDFQDQEQDEDTQASEEQLNPDEDDLLTQTSRNSKVSVNGNFRFIGGLSSGWNYTPWDPGESEGDSMDNSALMDMRSNLSLNFQVGPQFRVLQKYTIKFPDFDIEVEEFFCDYNFNNSLFMRLGRQNLTWGISRNYPFTNLPGRVPDNFNSSVEDDYGDRMDLSDSYAAKFSIPYKLGGFEFLGFTRRGFFPEGSDTPSADSIGYGFNYNHASTMGDFTVGSYYMPQMKYRSFYSFSTTLFGSLELYQEGLFAYDVHDIYEDEDYAFSANIGLFYEMFKGRLKLSTEYFYNGEKNELDVKRTQFPLITGHNTSSALSWRFSKLKTTAYSQVKYNVNENTGLFIPGLRYNGIPYVDINLATPLVWGSKDGTYYVNNPDDNDRPFSVILTITLSGKI